MNKVELIGRISTDITNLKFDDGKQMARFIVAINNQKQRDKAEFFSVVAWEKLAGLITDYCKKGDRIAVCGELKTNNYTSSKGEKWHAVEVYAHEVEFLENKSKHEELKELTPIDDDKLPF